MRPTSTNSAELLKAGGFDRETVVYYKIHELTEKLDAHFGEDDSVPVYWMMESMIINLISALEDLNESKGSHIVIDPKKVLPHIFRKFDEACEDAIKIFPKERM